MNKQSRMKFDTIYSRQLCYTGKQHNCVYAYFLFLKMILNPRQTMINDVVIKVNIPLTTVTTTTPELMIVSGVPSGGTPSVEHMTNSLSY